MTFALALLIDMSLKASLLCLGVAVAAALARPCSAVVRHNLWMAAVACAALLPAAASMARFVGPDPAFAPVHHAVTRLALALPANAPGGAVEAIDRIWSGDGATPLAGWAVSALVLLWLGGVAVAAARAVIDHRAAAALVRRASPYAGMPSPAGVRLLTSAEVNVPAAFGTFTPTVLLPEAAADWPELRLRSVLAHEMAHVARRDCALEWVVRAALALHWFNPLVVLAARSLRAERELACDERVIAAGIDPRNYAATLIDIARDGLAGPPRAMLAMARTPQLERRVRLLLDVRRKHGTGVGRFGGFAWAGAAAFLLLSSLTAPASGMLGAGSVQPGGWPMRGLDDPMSERLPLPYEDLAVAAAAVRGEGPAAAAIEVLKQQLDRRPRNEDDLIRERAIWTLAQVREGRLVEPLAARIDDTDWRVRAYAAWGLHITGDSRATPHLMVLLDDPVWRVRAMAAAGLSHLADPRAAEAVMAALDDPAWQVRVAIIHYVENRRDRILAARLRPLLDDPHVGTRLRAQELLARF